MNGTLGENEGTREGEGETSWEVVRLKETRLERRGRERAGSWERAVWEIAGEREGEAEDGWRGGDLLEEEEEEVTDQ